MKKLFLALLTVIVFSGCATSIGDFIVTDNDSNTYKSSNVTTKDYQNAGYVLETRGNNEIACINLGSKDGIKKGTKISFYKIAQRMNKRYQIPFAEGRVFQVGEESSWVKVKSFETAGVKINHFAKPAADQSFSFGEKMLWPPRFFNK